jgi:aminoacyl tRNA synthase complex-interacting multifunctional protein 1
MPVLKYTKDDDDLKFLIYCQNQSSDMILDSTLSLDNIEGLDLIIQYLFSLYTEEFTNKAISDFKKFRKTPTIPKEDPLSKTHNFTLLNTLCYINLLKDALLTGSLKNKDFIDKYTKVLSIQKINFDPEFLFLEIRAGLITSIENAEGLDKLYCECVESNKNYFICSGLRQHYKKEDLLKNTYLFLLNIKKVKFKTLESEGMICCTEDVNADQSEDKQSTVEAIKIDTKPGDKIELENQLVIFSDLEFGKFDLTKNAFKLIFSYFKIIDHFLTFKGIKVKINGNYILTKSANGPVR